MTLRRSDGRLVDVRQGHVFTLCIGGTYAVFAWVFGKLLDIPTDVPLRDVLTAWQTIGLFALLAVNAVLSYFASIAIALGADWCMAALRRSFTR